MTLTITKDDFLNSIDKQALFKIRGDFIENYCNGDISMFHSVPIETRIEQFAFKYEAQIIKDLNEKVLKNTKYRFVHNTQGSAYENSVYGDAEIQDENGNTVAAVDFKWAAFSSHQAEVATPTRRSLENFGNNVNGERNFYICFDKDFEFVDIYNAKVAYNSRKEAGDFDKANYLQYIDKALTNVDARRFIKYIGHELTLITPIFMHDVYNVTASFNKEDDNKIEILKFENVELNGELTIDYLNHNDNTLGADYQTFMPKKSFVIRKSNKEDGSSMILSNIVDSGEVITLYFKSEISKKSADITFSKQGNILKQLLESGANNEIARKVNDEKQYYVLEFL